MTNYPNELTMAANLLVAAKMGKLAFTVLAQSITVVLLALAALKWCGDKISGNQGDSHPN